MVKIGNNRDPWGWFPSHDAALESPSSPSGLVESSQNEVDSGNDCATPRSASSSDNDGKEGLMSSLPTDTQLMPEFNTAGDAGGSGSSSSPSSSGALALQGVLLQATPVATNSTVIMVSELLDNDDLALGLVSSGCQGSNGGGSSGRRSASNDQFPQREGHRRMYAPRNNRYYEVGSSSRQQPAAQQWRRVSLPNIQTPPQQRPEFPYPFNLRRPPGFRVPPNMNFPPPTPPPWSAAPRFATGLRVQRGPPPVQAPMYLYGSPASSSIYPPYEFATVVPARRSSGLYPPPGVTIRHPPTTSGDQPPLPAQPSRTSRVTITAPPASERASSSSALKQPEATPPVQVTRGPTFRWPPIAEEDALFTERLHGPSGRSRRLPVFEEICPSDEPSQPPLPPPPPPSQPSPPPPPPSHPPPPPPSPPPPPPGSP